LEQMSSDNHIVEIFTDGACSGNPGPGGYGAIIRRGGKVEEISGCDPQTTNNRMELTAVIEALRRLGGPCRVRLVTDSQYVVQGITKWVPGWIRQNWTNSRKKPVLNSDLWKELLHLSEPHRIQWEWVQGHHGHPENERCDRLARDALRDCLSA